MSVSLRDTFLTFLMRDASISGEESEWNSTVVTASSPIIISEEGNNDWHLDELLCVKKFEHEFRWARFVFFTEDESHYHLIHIPKESKE